jgi:hypothetical protein
MTAPWPQSRSAHRVIILLFYGIAFGLIILNDGLYWDDWTLVHQPYAAIKSQFTMSGGPMWVDVHWFFLSRDLGVFVYRSIVFISFGAVALMWYEILQDVQTLDHESRFWVALVAALFPVNFARISLSCTSYAVELLSFFAGALLLLRSGHQFMARAAGAVLCFLSFHMQSLLLAYFALFLFLLNRATSGPVSARSFGRGLAVNADLLILPFLFAIYKFTVLKTSGLYADYNQLQLTNFADFVRGFARTIQSSFVGPLEAALLPLVHLSLAAIAVLFVAALLGWLTRAFVSSSAANGNQLRMLWWGAALFAAAVVPYLLVGKVPAFEGFDSRHQILVPFGASIIVWMALKWIFALGRAAPIWPRLAAVLVCASFVVMNVLHYIDYQRDWFKQLALIKAMQQSEAIRSEGTTFLVDDLATYWSPFNREYNYFELNGMLKLATGQTTRFASLIGHFSRIENYEPYRPYIQYNMNEYVPAEPQFLITILPGPINLSRAKVLALLGKRFAAPRQFQDELQHLLTLKLTKLDL